MSNVLLVEKSEGIATLTLNRPEAMNALSRELRCALVEAFRNVAADAEVGIVILTGAGRAFSAGVDLKELGGERPTGLMDEKSDDDIVGAMTATPQPILGAVNGVAVTGGFEIALACDLLFAARVARFADTHARVGILPGWALSVKLPRLIGISHAKELSLTGNFLSAERAEEWGLVNRVVEPEELMPACRALAQDMLSCDPATMRGYKRLIDEGAALPLADALVHERRASREHLKSFDPAALAARRRSIQDRGRSQQ
ncbi:MAG: enoyl-CoA hydratase [Candidatus Binatia bacterium]